MAALPTGNGAAVERLMSKVVVADSGCWEFTGHRDENGYGRIQFDGRSAHAHRVAWILRYDVPAPGLHVLHHCDNPPCCNPRHLYVGTNDDNVADRVRRGRSARQLGERHGRAKLSDQDVADLRALADGGVHYVELAQRFGISPSHASQIARRVARPRLNQKWRGRR